MFGALLVPDRDEVAIQHHARLFGSDPVGDETAVFPGFLVIPAVVADEVIGGQLADEVEEVSGHDISTTLRNSRSGNPNAECLWVGRGS